MVQPHVISFLFKGWIIFHYVHTTLCIHSFIDRHLGSLHLWVLWVVLPWIRVYKSESQTSCESWFFFFSLLFRYSKSEFNSHYSAETSFRERSPVTSELVKMRGIFQYFIWFLRRIHTSWLCLPPWPLGWCVALGFLLVQDVPSCCLLPVVWRWALLRAWLDLLHVWLVNVDISQESTEVLTSEILIFTLSDPPSPSACWEGSWFFFFFF